MRVSTLPMPARFWMNVDEVGECWIWTACRGGGTRYGSIRLDGRMQPAHRVAYEMEHGPIPDGLELDHLCSQPLCVRPDHLEPVTHRENLRRGKGWAGQNARKTVCSVHGTPFDHITDRGRLCRQCHRDGNRAYRQRQAVR